MICREVSGSYDFRYLKFTCKVFPSKIYVRDEFMTHVFEYVQNLSPEKRDIASCFLLVVPIILFFSPSIFHGEYPSGADALYKVQPWRSVEGGRYARNPLLHDAAFQFLPWKRYAARSIRNGTLPFWNPHNSTGVPFVGNGQSSIFYPLYCLYWLHPSQGTWLVIWMLKIWIALCFSYLFLRQNNLRCSSSLFGAISFGFCGAITLLIYNPITNVLIFLPGLFFGLKLLHGKQSSGGMAFLSLLISLQFFGGHIETSAHLALITGIYFLFLIFSSCSKPEIRKKFLFYTSGSVLFGLLIASIQLMPFLEYLYNSKVLVHRSAASTNGILPKLFSFFAGFPSLVFPEMYGSVIGGTEHYVGFFFTVDNFPDENMAFIGVLPLLFAVLSIRYSLSDRKVLLFSLLFALGILIGFGDPFLSTLLDKLPGFELVNNSRLKVSASWAGSVLASFQFERLVTRSRERRFVKKVLLYGASGFLAVFVVGKTVQFFFKERFFAVVLSFFHWIYQLDPGAPGHTFSWSFWEQKLPEKFGYVFGNLQGEVAIVIVVFVAGWLFLHFLSEVSKTKRLILYAFIFLVVFADHCRLSKNYVSMLPDSLHYPETKETRFLQSQQNGRFLGLDGVLQNNTNLWYGFDDLRNYDAMNIQSVQRFLSIPINFRWMFNKASVSDWRSSRNLLNYLNIQYVGSSRPLDVNGMKFISDRNIYLYENKQRKNRYFLAKNWEVKKNSEHIWNALNNGWNPVEAPLLKEKPEFTGQKTKVTDQKQQISITSKGPNHVYMRISCPGKRMLVSSSSYYPGWSAEVDGNEREIYRVNGAFRGIPIRAGTHSVKLTYRPSYWYIILPVSILSFLGMIILLISPVVFRYVYVRK